MQAENTRENLDFVNIEQGLASNLQQSTEAKDEEKENENSEFYEADNSLCLDLDLQKD